MPLNNVSFMKPNAGAPLDIQTQQQQLALQAAIAQALISRGMQDQSPVIHGPSGNPFARDIPNIGGQLGSYFDRKHGEEQMADIGRRQGELAEETQRMTQADIAKALLARSGTPAMGSQDAGGEAATSAVPPNYNKYVETLMTSRVPKLNLMGAEAAKHMLNPQDILKEADRYAQGTAAAAAGGDMGVLAPKPKLETYEGSARAFNEKGEPVGPPAAINTFEPMAKNSAGVVTQKSPVTGQEKAIGPQGDVSTQKSFDNADSAKQMEMIELGAKQFMTDQSTLGKLSQVRSDMASVPDSAFGTFSWLRTQGNRLGELLGADKMKEVPNIESIRSTLGSISLDKVRLLAPVSDNDWDKIREILGTEGYTKRGLTQVIGIMEAATHANMERHIRQVDVVAEKSGNPDQFRRAWVPEYRPEIVPSGAPTNPYKGMPDADIMKRLRGGG